MTIDWTSIAMTVEAWAEILKGIQDRAAQALKDGNARQRDAAKVELQGFLNHSPALVDGMDELDRQASQTFIDLNDADIAAAIARIAARTASIVTITKTVERATAEANAAARSIALANVSELIDQLTAVVTQAKKVKASLAGDDTTAVATDIDALIDAAAKIFPKLRTLQDG